MDGKKSDFREKYLASFMSTASVYSHVFVRWIIVDVAELIINIGKQLALYLSDLIRVTVFHTSRAALEHRSNKLNYSPVC